jgi:integration host factor subunit alpha
MVGGGMRKADIANEIFKQVGISKNEAADIVEMVLNLLKSV